MTIEDFLPVALITWAVVTVIGILCAVYDRRRPVVTNPSPAGAALPAQDHSPRERERARQHLTDYCSDNADFLADDWPPPLMEAFLQSEMTDDLEPVLLWKIANEKIAELQKIVVVNRAKWEEDEPKRRQEELDSRRRAAEITACELEIERLKNGDGDPEEIQKQQRHLRQLRDAADRVDVVTPQDL